MNKAAGFLLIFIAACYSSCSKKSFEITDHPEPSMFRRGKLSELPEPAAQEGLLSVLDLRSYDLTGINTENQLAPLFMASFDSSTVWPGQLPRAFRPQSIIDIGKNPGLGIRSLHKNRHTGKGISIAIIGQPLLLSHNEYSGRIRFYEEINIRTSRAQLQGCAAASLTAGSGCGTAPQADLFYIAASVRETSEQGLSENLAWLASAVEKILEINKQLSRKEKIHVLCISMDWNRSQTGYDQLSLALQKAVAQDIFVISPRLSEMYGFSVSGLGREVYDDPDDTDTWKPSLGWSRMFFSSGGQITDNSLLVPADARTAAGPAGDADYVFYRGGSSVFVSSWLCGLYALALEIYPKLTPRLFLQTALDTAGSSTVRLYTDDYPLNGIIRPKALIQSLMDLKLH